MKSVASLKRGSIVTLNKGAETLEGNKFFAGDTFKFLSIFNGCMVRLSRIGDCAKLNCTAESIGYTFAVEGEIVAPYVSPRRPDYTNFDYAHSDASGASREIITAVCLAGKDSGFSTIHLTPSEELAYNAGMARMAEMG